MAIALCQASSVHFYTVSDRFIFSQVLPPNRQYSELPSTLPSIEKFELGIMRAEICFHLWIVRDRAANIVDLVFGVHGTRLGKE